MDLAEIQAGIRTCVRCPLHEFRGGKKYEYAVPARAGKEYRGGIALLGEAPGMQEAGTGWPMVGPTGRLADELLVLAGLSRAEVVVLNRLRCRPPDNDADRYPEAFEACDDWLVQELKAYDPKVVVLMGRKAIGGLFGANPKVGKLRGMWLATGEGHRYGKRAWIVTYHPAASFRRNAAEIRGYIVKDLADAKRGIG